MLHMHQIFGSDCAQALIFLESRMGSLFAE